MNKLTTFLIVIFCSLFILSSCDAQKIVDWKKKYDELMLQKQKIDKELEELQVQYKELELKQAGARAAIQAEEEAVRSLYTE